MRKPVVSGYAFSKSLSAKVTSSPALSVTRVEPMLVRVVFMGRSFVFMIAPLPDLVPISRSNGSLS